MKENDLNKLKKLGSNQTKYHFDNPNKAVKMTCEKITIDRFLYHQVKFNLVNYTPRYGKITNKILYSNFPCPRCSKNLIFKKGKFGDFIGCASYPHCKYSTSLLDGLIKKFSFIADVLYDIKRKYLSFNDLSSMYIDFKKLPMLELYVYYCDKHKFNYLDNFVYDSILINNLIKQ
jgi:ssDNA-binding Zn-finger/Zn-ribbon topoisomerase 1